MFSRLFCLASVLYLLAQPISMDAPKSLPECQTVAQVEAMVRYPVEGAEPVAAERGFVRYISQEAEKEPDFCAEYWYGGEPGSDLDLTLERNIYNTPYEYYAGNMCTRAVYSMALSYLGIDLTPGDMSALLNKRDVKMPYDEVTDALPEIERVTFPAYVFQNMFEAYQADSSYSPVYLYIRRPNKSTHAVLVVAQQEDGRYIVVDPKYHGVDGVSVHVYTIALSKNRQFVVNSDFYGEQAGSTVLAYCQWRLVQEE